MSRTERQILNDVKRLAVEQDEVTGKPLGVTGEIAEVEAADKLGLELADPRMKGYDAIRPHGSRAFRSDQGPAHSQRQETLSGTRLEDRSDQAFDTVALVLLDPNYDAIEIWEAPRQEVEARINAPGSKARNERGSLGISQFKSIAERAWTSTRS